MWGDKNLENQVLTFRKQSIMDLGNKGSNLGLEKLKVGVRVESWKVRSPLRENKRRVYRRAADLMLKVSWNFSCFFHVFFFFETE